MSSMNIRINKEYDDLSTLYWIQKVHMNPYRERYMAGCSIKELSISMTKILSAVKGGLQSPFM
jgi:hypothetical protein